MVHGDDLGPTDLVPKSGVLPRARGGANAHQVQRGAEAPSSVQSSMSKAEQVDKLNDDLLALLNKS